MCKIQNYNKTNEFSSLASLSALPREQHDNNDRTYKLYFQPLTLHQRSYQPPSLFPTSAVMDGLRKWTPHRLFSAQSAYKIYANTGVIRNEFVLLWGDCGSDPRSQGADISLFFMYYISSTASTITNILCK
jgi:hypothetical protein